MKTNFFTVCGLLVLTSMITACETDKTMENKIRAKVATDLPQLAVMDAVYLVQYTNLDTHWYRGDDFYINKSKATRSYGFEMKDVLKNLKIEDVNGKRVLSVRIPMPKKINGDGAENREPVLLVKTKDFKPKSDDKTIPKIADGSVDVEAVFDDMIDKQERGLSPVLMADAKRYTQIYFDKLAKKFELDKANVDFD